VQDQTGQSRKYVFVCGLQRSGTSVLARNIARFGSCTAFKNTGVIEDEGQYLQSVYPTNHQLGGAGRFGFHPRAHLTEKSRLLTPENVASLRNAWHEYWDPSKTICLEKTPGNLIMTRFLQTAFPNAYFIVIRRHPVPVSMATQKWSFTSLHSLFEHWLRCHDIFERDRPYLKHVYEIKYEDYIQDPETHHRKIAHFLDTGVGTAPMEVLTSGYNERYLQLWKNLLSDSSWKQYYQYIASTYEAKFVKHGYSLIKGLYAGYEHVEWDMKPIPATGWLYSRAVDAGTFLRRAHAEKMEFLTRPVRAIAPRALKDPLKRILKNKPLRWAGRLLAPRYFANASKKYTLAAASMAGAMFTSMQLVA
jgi:Sulfotransferase family